METIAKQHFPIAVSVSELSKWGCPYCGFRSGTTPMSGGGSTLWCCGECNKTSVALATGVTRSTIGIGAGPTTLYPELSEHPRKGTPSHGKPDKQPEGGGEFFLSRGIGTDMTPGCFICGGEKGHYHNISAFVQCKEAGERIVLLFPKGARLDFRDFEPDRVQVKIGACNKHLKNLKLLEKLTKDAQGIITKNMIRDVKK
ncbi:MAG: hypothetical protein WCV80_03250 [Candidatus Paceibacterota bacterium]